MNKKYTVKKIMEIAAGYTSLSAFCKNQNVYQAARRSGILKAATAHMVRERRSAPTKYSEALLRKIAPKYMELKSFRKNDLGLYHFAIKKGFSESVTAHMKRDNRGSSHVHQSRNMTFTKKVKRGGKSKYTVELLKAVAAKYGKLIDFRKKERGFYDFMIRKGLYYQITARMSKSPHPGNRHRKYTFQKLVKIAAKYATRKEFQVKAGSAYMRCYLDGILDTVAPHMKSNTRTRSFYMVDFSKILSVARPYKTMSEFRRNERGAYYVAIRNGLRTKLAEEMGWNYKRLMRVR